MDCYSGMKLLFPLSQISDDLDLEFEVEGAFFDRLRADIDLILAEIFPDTSSIGSSSTPGLLAGWEDLFGLIPVSGADTDARRRALLAKLQYKGGINRNFFFMLAGQFGYSRFRYPLIRIDDGQFPPFRCDDPVYGLVDISRINDNVSGGAAATWSVTGNGVAGDVALKASFSDLRPAATEVVFSDL